MGKCQIVCECWLDGRPLGHAVGLLARFAADNYTNWPRRIERLSAYILSIRTFVTNDAVTRRRSRQIKEGMPKRTHLVIHMFGIRSLRGSSETDAKNWIAFDSM
jgi:hypothetical protein